MARLTWIGRAVTLVLALGSFVGPSNALFDGKKKEEEKAKMDQAANDVQLGFAGIRQASSDPSLMQDLMKSMADPEIMQEAQKMMKDPAFQKQMKAMMGDKTVKEASQKAQEAMADLAKDPEKMKLMQQKMERMLAGEDLRPDLSAKMRSDAKRAAASQYGIDSPDHKIDRSLDGATNAMLGFNSLQDSMKDPKAMKEAMELMKDPAMLKEVQRMMTDPSFRAQFEAMQQKPEFKAAMMQGAEAMSQMMNDPDAAAKLKAQFGR